MPTGNFGNILAGWYAMKMGAPISRLILATNDNDILSRFFNSGRYSLGQVHQTLAPAMDIQVASNFERYLYYRLGEDADKLRGLMEQFRQSGSLEISADGLVPVDAVIEAGAATTDDVLAAIRRCWRENQYLIDPHTACGFAVAEALVPISAGQGRPSGDSDDPSAVRGDGASGEVPRGHRAGHRRGPRPRAEHRRTGRSAHSDARRCPTTSMPSGGSSWIRYLRRRRHRSGGRAEALVV